MCRILLAFSKVNINQGSNDLQLNSLNSSCKMIFPLNFFSLRKHPGEIQRSIFLQKMTRQTHISSKDINCSSHKVNQAIYYLVSSSHLLCSDSSPNCKSMVQRKFLNLFALDLLSLNDNKRLSFQDSLCYSVFQSCLFFHHHIKILGTCPKRIVRRYPSSSLRSFLRCCCSI